MRTRDRRGLYEPVGLLGWVAVAAIAIFLAVRGEWLTLAVLGALFIGTEWFVYRRRAAKLRYDDYLASRDEQPQELS